MFIQTAQCYCRIMKPVALFLLFCSVGCLTQQRIDREDDLPSTEDMILHRAYYDAGFRFSENQAAWTRHFLHYDDLMSSSRVKRRDQFRPDTQVPDEHRVHPRDYARSGFDKGHLVPAADMSHDETAMSESFLMSNMSPQRPDCNRKSWRLVEEWVRDYVKRSHNDVEVITGPVFDCSMSRVTIGRESCRVSVPDSYFKAVYDIKSREAIAFIVQNCGCTNSLESCIRDVDYVEQLTGLDLFRDDAAECVVHTNFWMELMYLESK